jgi:hypothetical protein
MTKPWDDEMFDGEDHEDEKEKLYKECKPEEFYFAFSNCYGGLVLTLTPAAYYDKHGYWFDQGVDIEHLLPEHLYPLDETNYSFKGSAKDLEADMLARGFRQNKKFTKEARKSGDGFNGDLDSCPVFSD